MENKIKIRFDTKYSMYISSIELQIAFKLWLGSDKDYEDARYICDILPRLKIVGFQWRFLIGHREPPDIVPNSATSALMCEGLTTSPEA